MKKILLILILGLTAMAAAADERKQCIDSQWHFMLGDGSSAVDDPGAADSWRTLSLPHDWSVEPEAAAAAGGTVIGPFSDRSIGGTQTGFTVGGDGWYQKTLRLTADDLKGRTVLYFEGAYNQTTLWVNGHNCGENVYGYSSFRRDVSDLVREGDNNIVVHVANAGNNSRWYAGSGIYRHVWFVRTGEVHLDEWDTYVRGEDNRRVLLTATVHNESAATAEGRLRLTLRDAEGHSVGESSQSIGSVAAGGSSEVNLSLEADGLRTWSPEQPYLYSAEITLEDGEGLVTDRITKRIGLRTLRFSAEEGFLLNGVPTLLRGGCVHHDNGLLGAAAFDKAETRKLRLIKALGYNAVRCSHNLPSEHFLDVCDELGLMVIDECFDQWLIAKNPDDYSRYFPEHSDEDLAVMVRRDRNHPSVIMWGIGNEIPGRISDEGMAVAERLREGVLSLDRTRPVTAAICGWDDGDSWNAAGGNWDAQCDKAFRSLDVGGYNYIWDKYEYDHARAPERVMCGLESYPKQASENWALVERLPYVIGDFVWTAMDYLGEAGIGAAYSDRKPPMFQPWPWFNGHCGDLDLIGQKKPQSYYKDVVWRERPVTMAVVPGPSHNNAWGWQLEEQHWTWTGREGQELTVNVYSRAPQVRLYLNGVSLGDRAPGATFWTAYTVTYQPGTLRVVNLDSEGQETEGEDFTLETTGSAVGVRCIYEDPTLSADEGDVAYVTLEVVDCEGRVVTSDCSTRLTVENRGAGLLIGCATGAPDDMESFRSTTPRVFRGRAQAVVRSTGSAGAVDLSVGIQALPLTSRLLRNSDFDGSLEGWTVSDANIIKYNSSAWHNGEINGFLECYTGWAPGTNTLGGQTVSQSTKVLPSGDYTLTFDYNGTFWNGSHYRTDGVMSGVTVSMGGSDVQLQSIDGNVAQKASLQFTLEEEQAVSFLVRFADDTNADWFALDNLTLDYSGPFDFAAAYVDRTVSVPAFGGSNWLRQEGNASGSYTESKLPSEIYNGAGLAYWSASAPKSRDFFRQDITGLPEGRYGLAAYCAANLWSGSDNDRNPREGAALFARTDGGAHVTVPVTSATYQLRSLCVDVKEGETLTVGMEAGSDNGNNWCYLANITLVQLSSGDGPSVVTLSENDTEAPEPADFVNVTVERTITAGKWATLCLPFALEKPEGWEVRELTSVDENDGIYTLYFGPVDGTLEAGKPYMVRTQTDVTSISADGVALLGEPVPVGTTVTMKGTFVSGHIPAGAYFVSGNKFYQAADESNTIKGFRAYFETVNHAARGMVANLEETTGVASLQGMEGPVQVYGVTGLRRGQVKRGINIIRHADGNVRKIFVK